ncbi:MAG TPA: hypothetical protein VFM74_00065 [Candidatus Limnocylindria bacterium]|nr:hypothetical protein [Candidatus Limnocylindria bacterium]
MVSSLRSETARVVSLAERDLARLWQLIAAGAAADEALHDLLPEIVREYGALGGALAAEWYDQQREKAVVRGRFVAVPIEPADRGAHALVGWALDTATDDATLKTLILGGVQRRVADHVRHTVMDSSVADPAARGWQRVGNGGCTNGFCDMLIARGAVYSEATADFAAHDHCQCSAVPAWTNEPKPVKPYTPTSRNITDADRANLREYLASH